MKRKQPFATQTFIAADSQKGSGTDEASATGKSGQSCGHGTIIERRTALAA